MSEDKSFHMTPDEFRRCGHAVIDWIADYQSHVESFPVLSQVKPGQIRASLPAKPPAQGEPFAAMLKDVDNLILPGITHWQSPNFFAYFPCNASGPGNSRRSSLIRPGRAGHALVHQSRLHGIGNPCSRLARNNAWIAGEIPFLEYGRRRDSGHGFECRTLRASRRSRTCHQLHQQQKRM